MLLLHFSLGRPEIIRVRDTDSSGSKNRFAYMVRRMNSRMINTCAETAWNQNRPELQNRGNFLG